ncbi:hypothetical protein GCM10009740_04010 [Terrabacter terrae]|uniref:Uncharacterized protein n=2 Tax=Terrabacter terrae TaxID=318434 RepID=A0ABP5F7K9_9MICO
MVLGFACAYAIASARATPLSSLVAALVVTAGLGAGAHVATGAFTWSGLAVLPMALVALRLWRTEQDPTTAPTKRPGAQLVVRAVLAGVLVAGLSTASHLLGAGLVGVLAGVPLVMSVVAPSIHRDAGSPAARSMLRGGLTVVPGTATFAAVLAVTLVPLGGPVAFATAGVAMALVNVGVTRWGDRIR